VPAHSDDHHALGLHNRKTVMWAFLGSDCLFFGALISTYLSMRGRAPVGPEQDIFNIPFTSVSTFVLLFSSLFMVLALAAIQRGDLRSLRIWLAGTAALGMVFLSGQVFEFTTFYEKGLSLDHSVFGSTFFVLTGFHGAHVTIGVLWLLSLFVLSLRGKIQQKDSLNVEIAGLYWHFVDIVWIIIFTVVYLIKF
jgi:heme/copper-type cytochrome/quinol oxidase subunit 3